MPYSDGATHVIFESPDFISKLAELAAKPRVNLARFHGVFAPTSKYCIEVTPDKHGKGRFHPVTIPDSPLIYSLLLGMLVMKCPRAYNIV